MLQDLADGNTDKVTDMRWLQTTAEFFLHEMMHARLAAGGVEPQIIDEFVGTDATTIAHGPV